MKTRTAASYRRVDSFSSAPAIRARAKKRRSSTPSKPPIEAVRALARLRAEARAEIERLIDFLDATDVDCDLEDNGDTESNLGGECLSFADDREEDLSDLEPSLGWCDNVCQSVPNTGSRDCDVEQGQFVAKPKRTSRVSRQVTVENSYRRFVEGITPRQKALMKPRLDRDSWVVLR